MQAPGTKLPKESGRAAGQVAAVPSLCSPKQVGLLGGLPTLSLPGSQVLPPLFFFSGPFASVLLMFPPHFCLSWALPEIFSSSICSYYL